MSSTQSLTHCQTTTGSAKLFLFGATGLLGSALLRVLTAPGDRENEHENYSKYFQVTALVRAETLESKEEKKLSAVFQLQSAGVHLVTGDVQKSDVADIAKWISGQDIVLSALSSSVPGPSIELKLLEAVKLAKVPWLIPGMFSSDISKIAPEILPPVTAKKGVMEAVLKSGVNSFFILNYLLTERLINPFFGVDIPNATITAVYSFDSKVSTTPVRDVARLTAEALVQRNEPHVKNQLVHIASDTVSFHDVHRILEEHFKKPFKKVIATKEEILGAIAAADTIGKTIPTRFRAMLGEQKGVFIDPKDTWNATHARHIKVTTMKEFVAALKP